MNLLHNIHTKLSYLVNYIYTRFSSYLMCVLRNRRRIIRILDKTLELLDLMLDDPQGDND